MANHEALRRRLGQSDDDGDDVGDEGIDALGQETFAHAVVVEAVKERERVG